MNWCPRFTDKPFRMLFDTEVWLVLLFCMGTITVIGVNQAISIVLMLVAGYFIQKTVDRNKKGYIIHIFCRVGLLNYFPFGKYRI